MKLSVTMSPMAYGTSYVAHGTPQDVEGWWKRLCGSYHPAGYGTKKTKTLPQSDGTVIIHASRWNSCD